MASLSDLSSTYGLHLIESALAHPACHGLDVASALAGVARAADYRVARDMAYDLLLAILTATGHCTPSTTTRQIVQRAEHRMGPALQAFADASQP